MRKTVLMSLLALWLGASLVAGQSMETGYLLLAFGDISIEMSLWMALLLCGGFSLALVAVLKLGRFGVVGWQVVRYGRVRNSQRRMTLGLIDFIEGNWKAAKRRLLSSAVHAEQPLINLLAAARSAHELGECEEANRLLRRAEQCGPNNELAIALTQARIQLLDKKFEQCVATLERVKKQAPTHPVILDLLRQSYLALKDWPALQALLPALKKRKLYSEAQWREIEQQVYAARLREFVPASEPSSGDAEVLVQLQRIWKSMPAHLKVQPLMVELYLQQLLQYDGDDLAEQCLTQALQRHWDEGLIKRYGLLRAPDPSRQLLLAETWLRARPGSSALLLSLGRLCLRNRLWGKAREYFESSLALKKTPDAYAELARLLAHLGEHKKSTEYYQQGLLLMTDGLPALPMPG